MGKKQEEGAEHSSLSWGDPSQGKPGEIPVCPIDPKSLSCPLDDLSQIPRRHLVGRNSPLNPIMLNDFHLRANCCVTHFPPTPLAHSCIQALYKQTFGRDFHGFSCCCTFVLTTFYKHKKSNGHQIPGNPCWKRRL